MLLINRTPSQHPCLCPMQACMARLACIRLLETAVTPTNCFTLLHLATSCKLPSLAAAAHAVAMADFADACRLDDRGFVGLPLKLLMHVLGCDELVTGSELQVFSAAAHWVGADKTARLPHFHKLLGESLIWLHRAHSVLNAYSRH